MPLSSQQGDEDLLSRCATLPFTTSAEYAHGRRWLPVRVWSIMAGIFLCLLVAFSPSITVEIVHVHPCRRLAILCFTKSMRYSDRMVVTRSSDGEDVQEYKYIHRVHRKLNLMPTKHCRRDYSLALLGCQEHNRSELLIRNGFVYPCRKSGSMAILA